MRKLSRKNILIILPYGNLNPKEMRYQQLESMISCLQRHIESYKYNNLLKFFILISEQTYPLKNFNRGQLINIGLFYFKNHIGNPTILILHDIDILPNRDLFNQYIHEYNSMSLIPYTSDVYKKTYGFKLTTGSAIYSTKPDLFIKANGFPNNFWGWGGEDNSLHFRYAKNRIPLVYNSKGNYESIDPQRITHKTKMDYLKLNNIRNMRVWELLDIDKKNWKENGYNQVNYLNYSILSEEIIEYSSNLTMVHIKLALDESDK